MPEPFKNLFNKNVITGMSEHFAKAWPAFDRAGEIMLASLTPEDGSDLSGTTVSRDGIDCGQ